MPETSQPHLDLIIDADSANWIAQFRLLDRNGIQIAWHQTDFNTIPAGEQHALFDLRNYLDTLTKPGEEAQEVAKLGVCIAEKVLGPEILMRLWQAGANHTLRIQLPGASQENNRLAALLACVPWEIARPAIGQPSLMDNNLLLHIEQGQADQPDQTTRPAPFDPTLPLNDGDTLRVLFVFAEAKGSQPLGMRQERLQILRLFEKDIYPKRKVVAHFLTHGVTPARLRAQLRAQGGYHILHWSGHGNCGVLELAEANGASTTLTGAQLVDLFKQAAAPLPRLVFLSACNSGEAGSVQSMDDLMALAAGKRTRRQIKDIPLDAQPGFTGTAHALRQRGVPAVVAMRYSVGDNYARELAHEFYKNLLALPAPRPPAGALALARSALRTSTRAVEFDPCDHATPVLYGGNAAPFAMTKGRSPALDRRKIRLNPASEMAAPAIADFVGRTWELAELGANFIGSGYVADDNAAEADSAGCAVALVSGLGGMGKTALCAEALALWENNFTWVLIYQAKPNPLAFDATLRDIHWRLKDEQQEYYHHIKQYKTDAIHREADADADFTGPRRLRHLIENLVRAMQAEPILLVLDNFETNLKPQPITSPTADAGDNSALWQCQDEWWDECLKQLAQGLAGTGSRVLITCRHPLAALATAPAKAGAPALCHTTPLGPMAAAEAALFLRTHKVLQEMVNDDTPERLLAWRLLNTSRFHPLLMDRLAKLAAEPTLRPQLFQALETLEQRKDFSQLPALFASKASDASELAYLNHALAISIDQLLAHASFEARRLLWVIALANEAESMALVKAVWQGKESEQVQQKREFKQWLTMLAQQPESLPQGLRQELQALPAETLAQIQAELAALPPIPTRRPEPGPLLRHLLAVGLINAQAGGPNDTNPNLTCHELVRERISSWMAHQPLAQGDLTENLIRLAYADHLVAYFSAMQHRDLASALHAGSRAIVYCVQAHAYQTLEQFAGDFVTTKGNPRLMQSLLPYLRIAAEEAPEGERRWSCQCILADALRMSGQSDLSLAVYKQAAEQAHLAALAGGETAKQAWADLAWISGNAAIAFRETGALDMAQQYTLMNVEARKRADSPAIDILDSELDKLGRDLENGLIPTAMPEIETRLVQVAEWWHQYQSGTTPPDATAPERLARTYLNGLYISLNGHSILRNWHSALQTADTIIKIKKELKRTPADIAAARISRADVLLALDQPGEACSEVQACLPLLKGDRAGTAKALGVLARGFADQGDHRQAITQARRALDIFEDLAAPEQRATIHSNLANYLEISGNEQDYIEAQQHQLCALIYLIKSNIPSSLAISISNYSADFYRARTMGRTLAIPRVTELLAMPAYQPLKSWLEQCNTNWSELQSKVDNAIEAARKTDLMNE